MFGSSGSGESETSGGEDEDGQLSSRAGKVACRWRNRANGAYSGRNGRYRWVDEHIDLGSLGNTRSHRT